jgi:hypothetical protein
MKNIKEIADKFFEEQEKLNFSYDSREAFIEGFKLAKQMEKQQMEDVWHDSRVEDFGDNYIGKQKSFNDYYNETYNTKE